MNFKRSFFYFFAGSIILLSCQDNDFDNVNEFPDQQSQLNLRSLSQPEAYRDSIVPSLSKVTGDKSKPGRGVGVNGAGNDPKNVAPFASVSASTTFCQFVGGILNCYDVDKINDGDRDTRVGSNYSWANDFVQGSIGLPQHVNLKFGFPQLIYRIDIYTSAEWEIQDYTIRYRGPNQVWTTLVTVTGNTSVHREHDVGIIWDVYEIEIICQRGPSRQPQYARLNEVEIFRPIIELPEPPSPIDR
jgi:hypothetical protein